MKLKHVFRLGFASIITMTTHDSRSSVMTYCSARIATKMGAKELRIIKLSTFTKDAKIFNKRYYAHHNKTWL